MTMWAIQFCRRMLHCSSKYIKKNRRRMIFASVGLFLVASAWSCYLSCCSTPNIKLFPVPPVFIEPHLGNKGIFLLVLVTSTPWREDSLERRETIRITWGNVANMYTSQRCQVVFNLGRTYSESADQRIADESAWHNDILVGNFEDTYTNLIIKVLFSFEWASRVHCKFVLKADDDVYMHIPKFVKWLQSQETPDRLYAGALAKDTGIERLPWHRHFISYRTYNSSKYHPYCRGHFYVMSQKLLPELSRAVHLHEPFPVEDAYIGLIMKTLRVKPKSLPYCAWKMNSRKLKPCGNCFYHVSLCVGQSLKARDILYVHARFMALERSDQNSLEQNCAGLVLGDPWNTGVCKSETKSVHKQSSSSL